MIEHLTHETAQINISHISVCSKHLTLPQENLQIAQHFQQQA